MESISPSESFLEWMFSFTKLFEAITNLIGIIYFNT